MKCELKKQHVHKTTFSNYKCLVCNNSRHGVLATPATRAKIYFHLSSSVLK